MTTRRAKGTGSLVTRGDQRLGCYVTVAGQRVYAWCPRDDNTPRRQDAELRRLLNARDAHRLSPDARQPLDAYLTDWLAGRADLAPNTIRSYQQALAHIIPALGHTRLSDLSPAIVERFTRGLATTRPAAAAKARMVLGGALADAQRLGLLATNPARLARPVPPTPNTFTVYTAAEVRRLLEAATTERLGAFIVCSAYLGTRRGELLGLRWRDVDLDGATLAITVQRQYEVGRGMVERPPKADSARSLVLPPAVVTALRDHKARQDAERTRHRGGWPATDLVFTTHLGTPMWEATINTLLDRCQDRAGLPRAPLHSLRRGAISLLLAAGAPLPAVQQLAGHKSIATTARYVYAIPGGSTRTADLMADTLSPPDDRVHNEVNAAAATG
jgi:integrase